MRRRVLIFAVVCCILVSFAIRPVRAADELVECNPEPTDMTIKIGDIVNCAISPIADSDIFRFNGTAGDTIQLTLTDLTRGSGPTPLAQVFDPDQAVLDTLTRDGSGDVRQLTLSKTGIYTVLVTDDGDNNTVAYNLALQCLFGECANPLMRPLVGGLVRGFTPKGAICRNDTTGESVTITLERTTSWNCEAAGLVVNDGDQVFTGAEGEVGAELPPEVLGIFSETAEERLTPGEDAFIGTFDGGDAIFDEFVEDTDDVQEGTVSQSSTVSVNASGGGFAGWFVSWGTEEQAGDNNVVRDMSAFASGKLLFWVKSPINLEVGIRSGNVAAGSETSKLLLSQVDGFASDNTWQRLCIPLSTFAGSAPKADLRRMKVFFVVASNTPTGGTGGQPQTFLIDDVRWESTGCP